MSYVAVFAAGWAVCYFRGALWSYVLDGVAWVWGKVGK